MAPQRSATRLIKFAIFAVVLIVFGYTLSSGSGNSKPTVGVVENNQPVANVPVNEIPIAPKEIPVKEAPNPIKNTPAQLKDTSSHGDQTPLGSDVHLDEKIKACFVALVRNEELSSLVDAMRQIEDRFNRKYHYDYVFLNDKEFTEEFKETVQAFASGPVKFGLIPTDHWSYPSWIDQDKAAQVRKDMKAQGIIYGDSVSYRHMCRYESGFFWRHQLMDEYEYYWRIDPGTKVYCDIDYDIFKWMKDNDKKYSFTISLPEYHATIPTLWDTTKQFVKENPQFLNDNNLLEWISDDKGETYNGCHFWSNFEVASLDFWRSDAYRKYFDHLDQAGGFFYERWGDAPVHSIAAALFLDKEQIHFFDDLGYYHIPFHNCPFDKKVRLERKCACDPTSI
ncbi:hypothetical protein QCA50_013998 [Cerrena zonata]|uniref:Uncharacterized protein n=1 Tax=Cerrena zonata TaxID=2478898 RepID=A0AAW0FNV4_9APHY